MCVSERDREGGRERENEFRSFLQYMRSVGGDFTKTTLTNVYGKLHIDTRVEPNNMQA